ncbi:hypothetical protein ACGFX8_32730 [Streptomyces sp. NPDC048362]|uniref:hypothetical protein n=1 Tax=Streptomyces sp. NPDC048362 TaxID=3365539 RepID=UPI003711815B
MVTSSDEVRELDQADIPVIANGVSGSTMVGPDSPQRYFQISAPDGRVARVLADFIRHSPAVRKLTSGTPHAVVVYDPTDTAFSTHLKNLFVAAYRPHGGIDEIKYSEKPGAGGGLTMVLSLPTASVHPAHPDPPAAATSPSATAP